MSQVVVRTSNPRRNRSVTVSARTRTAPVRPRRTRARASANSLGRRNGSAASFAAAYSKTLMDPFEYAPVPLGYDCFLPTTMATGYSRGSFLVNGTDGSFSMYVMPVGGTGSPTDNSPIAINLNPLATSPVFGSWNGVEWSNQTSLTNSILESRIVSCGLRLFALFPETSSPGVLFAGTCADMSYTGYRLASTQTLCNLPTAEMGIGSNGACVTTRPYDNGSFEFFTQNTAGINTSSIPYHTSGFIAGQGFPIGTRIWYEAICHFEGIARTSSAAVATPIDEVPDTASSYFPTPQSLWAGISSILSSPITMDAALGALHVAGYGGVARGLGAARRLHGTTQGMFGRGSATVSSVLDRGRQNTLVIEEMKESSSSSMGGPPTGRRFF